MFDSITESGMDFILDNAFYIEKSKLYKELGDGVKTVEFIRATDNALLFVEARTTFANPNNPSTGNLIRFQTEIENICDKFIHSLNIFSSVKVGITENSFPSDFVLPEKASLQFVLVNKNHEFKWCRAIREKIISTLPLYLKMIWKPNVYVLNHEGAKQYNLATTKIPV